MGGLIAYPPPGYAFSWFSSTVEQPLQISGAVENADDLYLVNDLVKEDQVSTIPRRAKTRRKVFARRKTCRPLGGFSSHALKFSDEANRAIGIILGDEARDRLQVGKCRR
jgi:hypothetical protein